MALKRNAPVTVTRTLPNGKTKDIEYINFKEACMFTAMSLADNGYATKREAQTFQATIKDLGIHTYAGVHTFTFSQKG